MDLMNREEIALTLTETYLGNESQNQVKMLSFIDGLATFHLPTGKHAVKNISLINSPLKS